MPIYPIDEGTTEKSNKTYWLNLFTGTTWKEFRAAGATISGFRASRQKLAAKVKPGDVFLCYLTGVMRWVGAVEVLGPSQEKHAIWSQMSLPVQAVDPAGARNGGADGTPQGLDLVLRQ